jgi:predicted kinase
MSPRATSCSRHIWPNWRRDLCAFHAAAAVGRPTRASAHRNRCWPRRARTSSSCASSCRPPNSRGRATRALDRSRVRPAPPPSFAARKEGGFIREGHGDLHLGNLVLIDGRVTPFDCIEFNEDFRWNDPASEIAFVWIDLLDHGRPGLAAWFLNAWLEAGGDFAALAVLRFYAVYRAVVRAKIAALRARQEDADAARDELAAACGYLRLAWKIAVPPAPTLVITCGLSGSGKTTASSARLLDPTQAAAGSVIRLRSDVERKRLFGLAAQDSSHSPVDNGIYTAAATTRTYARLLALSRKLLAAGWPVLVDAAFLKRDERAAFRALADEMHVGFGILATAAPVEELRRRIQARSGDASEATVAVLERQLAWFEALNDAERRARDRPSRNGGPDHRRRHRKCHHGLNREAVRASLAP